MKLKIYKALILVH